jgi:4-hydroxybenzoate polyprenyltransferase
MERMKVKTLYYVLQSVRPKQWIKNLSLYIPITFWGYLMAPDKFLTVTLAVVIFCGLTSSIYLLNDYKDRELDKLHPGKKNRPIAAGLLDPRLALYISGGLALVSLTSAYFLSEYFFACTLVYMVLMVSYCLFLRNVIILDALTVAAGFVLRMWAGALVTSTPVSSWLIICTTGIALLISFGRRRCELTLLHSKAPEYRHTLQQYPQTYLDVIIAAVTSFSLLSYAFFTFIYPGPTVKDVWISYLPTHWDQIKWLMLTIPVALYGVFRYLYVIYEKRDAFSPEEAVFNDWPLLFSILAWFGLVIFIIYVI